MALFKALIPGLILTLVIAVILGSNGAPGGWLNVHRLEIEQIHFYWSWPLFFVSTGLGWFVFSTID
jgi:hypothetical protein